MVYLPIQKEPKQSKSTIFWIGKYTGCQSSQENGGFHTKWNPILHGLTRRCTSDPNLAKWLPQPLSIQSEIGFVYGIYLATLNIYNQKSTNMYIGKIYRSSHVSILHGTGSQATFFLFFSKAGPRDSFLFRVLKPTRGHQGGGQILTVPLNSELQQVDFRGGRLIHVGKPGVMEPIGFCHVVQPLVPSLPHIFWGNRFVGSKYLWCLEA